MRHFNYFENGGPAPSSCISCGNVKQLFEIGQLITGGMAQICKKCVHELAVFNGYAVEADMEDKINVIEGELEIAEKQLARVPDLVDGLINGIRNSVADFVFAVSYGDDDDQPSPVQDAPIADSGEHEVSKAPAGQRKAPIKSSSK